MPSQDLSGALTDEHLLALWLAARPASTALSYKPVAEGFLESLGGRPGGLKASTVAEVLVWFEGLSGAASTKARKVSTVKSLLSFAHRTGYTLFNVGRALRCVKVPSALHERIIEEPGIKALLGASQGRDHAFLRLMYASGARISELCRLRWVDLAQPGRVSLLGKGQKTRTILVPQHILDEVLALRPQGAVLEDPVFTSKRTPGAPLGTRDARNIVYRARDKVLDDPSLKGLLPLKCTPHALRHSHATIAIDKGCPLHILQHSLGHASVATTSLYLHVRPNKGSSTYLDV